MSPPRWCSGGGAPGKRSRYERAHHDHQGSAGARGAPSDMEISFEKARALTRRMAEIIAHHSGRSVDEVIHDIDRDYFHDGPTTPFPTVSSTG